MIQTIQNQGLVQDALVRLCQHPQMWAVMRSLPHPTGMNHYARGTPLNLGDYAWSMTMYPKASVEAVPIVIDALEQSDEFGCFDGFGRRDQENTRDFYNLPEIKALVKAHLECTGGAND